VLLGIKCPGGTFRHGLTDKCYSCPRGYNRSVYGINSSKACQKVLKGTYNKATKRGTSGCGKGYFQHGLTNRCYKCPKGYGRSLVITKDPSKHAKACEKIKIDPPAKIKKMVDAVKKKFTNYIKGKNGRTIRNAIARIRNVKLSKKFLLMSHKQKKAELAKIIRKTRLKQALSAMITKNIRSSSSSNSSATYKTLTLGTAWDFSFIGSIKGANVLAVNLVGSGTKAYSEYYLGMGFSAGGDVSIDLGLYKNNYDALQSHLAGLTFGTAVVGGLSVSLWWPCRDISTISRCYSTRTKTALEDIVAMQFSIQAGMGTEIEYGVLWRTSGE